MWCTSCQSDVAAEVSTDSKRVHCAICGNDLGTTSAARISDKTKEARELLARWSNREVLDPYGPLTKPETRPHVATSLFDQPVDQPEKRNPEPVPQPSLKQEVEPQFEKPLPPPESVPVDIYGQSSDPIEETMNHDSLEDEDSVTFQQPSFPQLRSDYRDIQDLIEEDDQSPNWLGLVGQLMAYGGVAVLTIGTTLVLWGYYGGPANYVSTGWLISTAGQMLLFLGVITLVSAGMEHTSTSVSRRIDRLGQRIFLFEQTILEQQKSQKNNRSVPQQPQANTTVSESTSRKSA
ncbi:hypothetical protein [uncultured Gimesia sp.]|uniref:hypothetical protein n=1 Tax=uncultured Gimesia sp. TaxID=1678688 RepID=UPI0030D7B915|tara:strand:- start:19314 stop:20189 length:876 start_codon:yes stop_codon:yes gene_type:complete